MLSRTNTAEQKPIVSIILPAWQAEETIEKVIKSVISQTYTDWELIVIDDGSTDGTRQKVSQFIDNRIKLLVQENSGVASARNKGIAIAQGDYIAFIDADDQWLPWKLESELACIQEHQTPECLIYSGYYAVDPDENLLNIPSIGLENGQLGDTVLNQENVMLPSTIMVHANIFKKLGGFNSGCYHEDRAWFIRACQQYPAFSTKDYLVLYQQSPNGRCRKILSNYTLALQAEFSILESVRDSLDKSQQFKLYQRQCQFLLYRFLMYGYLDDAKKFSTEYTHALKGFGKKAWLARLSLMSGKNLMQGSRIFVQTVYRNIISPVWKLQIQGKINTRLSNKAVADLSNELPLLGQLVRNN